MPIKLKDKTEAYTPENAKRIQYNKNLISGTPAYADVWDVRYKDGDYLWCKPFYVIMTKTSGISGVEVKRTSTKEPTCQPDNPDGSWNWINWFEIDPEVSPGYQAYQNDTYTWHAYLNEGYEIDEPYKMKTERITEYVNETINGCDLQIAPTAHLVEKTLTLSHSANQDSKESNHYWYEDKLGSWDKTELKYKRFQWITLDYTWSMDTWNSSYKTLVVTVWDKVTWNDETKRYDYSGKVDQATYTYYILTQKEDLERELCALCSPDTQFNWSDDKNIDKPSVECSSLNDDGTITLRYSTMLRGQNSTLNIDWSAARTQSEVLWRVNVNPITGAQTTEDNPTYFEGSFVWYADTPLENYCISLAAPFNNQDMYTKALLNGTISWHGPSSEADRMQTTIYGIRYYHQHKTSDATANANWTSTYDWTYYGYDPKVKVNFIDNESEGKHYVVDNMYYADYSGSTDWTGETAVEMYTSDTGTSTYYKSGKLTTDWDAIIDTYTEDSTDSGKRTYTIVASPTSYLYLTVQAYCGEDKIAEVDPKIIYKYGFTPTWTSLKWYPAEWVAVENELKYSGGQSVGTISPNQDSTIITKYASKYYYVTFAYNGTGGKSSYKDTPATGWYAENSTVTCSTIEGTNADGTTYRKVYMAPDKISITPESAAQLESVDEYCRTWSTDGYVSYEYYAKVTHKIKGSGAISYSGDRICYRISANANEHSTFTPSPAAAKPQFYNAGDSVNLVWIADEGYLCKNNNTQRYGVGLGTIHGASTDQMQFTYFTINSETGIAFHENVSEYYVPPVIIGAQQTLTCTHDNTTVTYYSDEALTKQITTAATDSQIYLKVVPNSHCKYMTTTDTIYSDSYAKYGPLTVPVGGNMGTYNGIEIIFTYKAKGVNDSWTAYGATKPTSSTNTAAVTSTYAQRATKTLYYASNPAAHYGKTVNNIWYYKDSTNLYTSNVAGNNSIIVWDDKNATATYTLDQWAAISYAVSGGSSSNGTLSWTTPKTYGATSTVTITPNTGYKAPTTYTKDWTLNDTNFTISDANKTAVFEGATFPACEAIYYTLTYNNSNAASIINSKSATTAQLKYGDSFTIKVICRSHSAISASQTTYTATRIAWRTVDGNAQKYWASGNITGKMPANDLDLSSFFIFIPVKYFEFGSDGGRAIGTITYTASGSVAQSIDINSEVRSFFFTEGISPNITVYSHLVQSDTTVRGYTFRGDGYDDRAIYDYSVSGPLQVDTTVYDSRYLLNLTGFDTLYRTLTITTAAGPIDSDCYFYTFEKDSAAAVIRSTNWSTAPFIADGIYGSQTANMAGDFLIVTRYDTDDDAQLVTLRSSNQENYKFVVNDLTYTDYDIRTADSTKSPSSYDINYILNKATVTFNSTYGTWTNATLQLVPGTTWTTSNNVVIFSDGTTNTFTPTTASAQYEYIFNSITASSGAVESSGSTITGSAERIVRQYKVINNTGAQVHHPSGNEHADLPDEPISTYPQIIYEYGAKFSLKIHWDQQSFVNKVANNGSNIDYVCWHAAGGVEGYRTTDRENVDDKYTLPTAKILYGTCRGNIIIKSVPKQDFQNFTVTVDGPAVIRAICGTTGAGTPINKFSNDSNTVSLLATLPFKISSFGAYADSISENITASSATGGVTGLWIGPCIYYGTASDDSAITSYSWSYVPELISNSNFTQSTKVFDLWIGSSTYPKGYTRVDGYTTGVGYNNNSRPLTLTVKTIDSRGAYIKWDQHHYYRDVGVNYFNANEPTYSVVDGGNYPERAIISPYNSTYAKVTATPIYGNGATLSSFYLKDGWKRSTSVITCTTDGGQIFGAFGYGDTRYGYTFPLTGDPLQCIAGRTWNCVGIYSPTCTNTDRSTSGYTIDGSTGWTKTVKTFYYGTVTVSNSPYFKDLSNRTYNINGRAYNPGQSYFYANAFYNAFNITNTDCDNRIALYMGNSYGTAYGTDSKRYYYMYLELFRDQSYNDHSSWNNLSLKTSVSPNLPEDGYNPRLITPWPNNGDNIGIYSQQVYKLEKPLTISITKNWT